MALKQPRGRGDRGASAVEFALIVPFLLLLVFGIISYGLMLSFRQGISQAAAEGARAAAVAPPSANGDTAKARAYQAIQAALGPDYSCVDGTLKRGPDSVGTCAVSVPSPCTVANCAYRVTVTYNYKDFPVVPGVPLVPMPDSLSYEASAEGNA